MQNSHFIKVTRQKTWKGQSWPGREVALSILNMQRKSIAVYLLKDTLTFNNFVQVNFRVTLLSTILRQCLQQKKHIKARKTQRKPPQVSHPGNAFLLLHSSTHISLSLIACFCRLLPQFRFYTPSPATSSFLTHPTFFSLSLAASSKRASSLVACEAALRGRGWPCGSKSQVEQRQLMCVERVERGGGKVI